MTNERKLLRKTQYTELFRFLDSRHHVWHLVMKDARRENGKIKVLVENTHGATAWVDWETKVDIISNPRT